MYLHADGDIAYRHGVAVLNRRLFPGDNSLTYDEFVRCQHVPFFTVPIYDKCYLGAAVRIIFDTGNTAFHIYFIPCKINDTVSAFVPAAAVADTDPSLMIASRPIREMFCQ